MTTKQQAAKMLDNARRLRNAGHDRAARQALRIAAKLARK